MTPKIPAKNAYCLIITNKIISKIINIYNSSYKK